MGEPGFSSSYHMGHSTMVVPMKLFVENRRRLLEKLRKEAPESIVFLQGGVAINHYDTDTEYPFRQESFFHWLFGVTEPGFYGAIDVSSGKSYLFYPKMPLSAAVWVGKLPSDEELKIKYLVDNVLSDEDIHATLTNLNRKSILVLNGMNTDSKLTIQPPSLPSLESFKLDTNRLFPIIVELRVIKTEMEIEVLRYAAKISVEAHKHVMKNLKAGMYEYQGEALFQYYVYNFGGCRSCAYTCICASGCNASVLHYGHAAKPNNKLIKDGDFCLFDMGASYYNYSADITVTFPINGKFTKNQKIVYTAVMRAREAVFNNLCPGVYWTDMHTCAIKAMLTYLKEQNLLNKSVDEMFEAGLGAVFQPHGLGHLIGIDVHDVGGYTEGTPERPSSKHGLHTLRTARKLLPGMVVTVEPGCYFIDHVLNEAFENPRLNCFLTERINEFRGIGGVRIEDDVLITESGYELLSKDLPRTIEEIEDFMASN